MLLNATLFTRGGKMIFSAMSDKGRVREQNEDSYGCKDNLFVVADGMGGHLAGEIASAIAVETILTSDLTNGNEIDLREAILRANEAILAEVSQNADHIGMGTTVAVLQVLSDSVIIAHVGDSRIYCLNGQNELKLLTKDHSLVAELLQNGEITENEAKTHPQRNLLTKALGTKGLEEVDVNRFPLKTGDKFLICSDGLTGMVDESVIREMMIENENPKILTENLINLANENGGIDNITVIAIYV